LTAKYDFTLEYAVSDEEPDGLRSRGVFTGDAVAAADLTGAMQEQLGLKLEAKRSLIEMLVVDHADKTPTEN